MKGDAEASRALACLEQKRRRFLFAGTELPLQGNEAMGVGTGDPQEQGEVVRPARLLDDLVELIFRIESEAPYAEVPIGAGNGTARLHRVHEIELGAFDRGHPLDLNQGGDIAVSYTHLTLPTKRIV